MALDPQYMDAIKGFEGYNPDPNGAADYKQYSSGYGTKVQPGDENIPPDQRQAVYDQRFQNGVDQASQSVDSFAPNLPTGVRAALTSLTYNAGPSWQQAGLGQAIKAGDFDKAQQLFLQYNHAGGEVNPGLTARRQQEATWFGGGQTGPQNSAPASPASPAIAPPQSAPPIFPQGAPQPQQAAGPSPLNQLPPPMPLQIQFARPHPVDLSRLRAQLAQAPIYART